VAGDAPRPTLSFLAQSTEYAAHIRNAFQDVGLAGALRALPIDRLFSPSSVRDVVRAADGFQPHLVSPEAGLRRLVADALALADGPVDACVRRIHAVLVAAARDAATRASLLTDASTLDAKGREPLRLPAFEAAVVAAATKALEGWRDDALRVARTVVDMERSYVTAAFFRHKAMDRGGGGGGGVGRRSTNRAATDSDSDDGGPGLARTAPPPPSMHASSASGDIKSGYLDKRTSDTATRASLPDAFRWQRRYFVLAEPRGMLYYFKSPDDPPNYKGAINMRECRVEDLDAEGGVKGGGQGGRYDLDGGASAAPSPLSLLFRISAKRPGGAVVKGNTHIVLRAESASDKYSWLARLRAACGGGGDAAPLPPLSPSATRAAGPLASGAARSGTQVRRSSEGGAAATAPPSPPPPPASLISASGIGSAVAFDTTSKLGPEPVYAGSGGHDAFLAALGADTAAYVRTVCATIAVTVPKAAVHCQVKRAQGHLLEALYAAVGGLGPDAIDGLLLEAGDAGARRAAVKAEAAALAAALRDLSLARDAASAARGGRVAVPRGAAALAGGVRASAAPPLAAPGTGPTPRRRPPPAPPGVG
jgi:dynamin GTPase